MVGNVRPPAKILPVVKNIKIVNISGNATSGGAITGLEGSPIQNITFQNCNITVDKGLTIQYATGLDTTGLKLTEKMAPIIYK